MDKHSLSTLIETLEPLLQQNGYELVDIRFVLDQGYRVLRVYIDRLDVGITIADCSRVTRLLDPVLDVSNVVSGRYRLEVSSPGLDRPLRTRASFERAIGEEVKIRLDQPENGQRNFKGTLKRVEGDQLVQIILQDETGRDHTLSLLAIEQATVIGKVEVKKGEAKKVGAKNKLK